MDFYTAVIGLGIMLSLSALLRRFYRVFRFSRVIAAWLNTFAATFVIAFILNISGIANDWRVGFAMAFVLALSGFFVLAHLYVRLLSDRFDGRFPTRYKTENSWKVGKFYSVLKNRIKRLGFSQDVSSKTVADGYEAILAYTNYFLSSDKNIFLSFEFVLPETSDEIAAHLISKIRLSDSSERFILTRNANRPIGLFAPKDWTYSNYPMVSDIFKLLKIHHKKIEMLGGIPIPMQSEPIDFVRSMEKDWQNANVDYGILTPPDAVQENGVLTSNGKYRLWIEILLLTYFGYAPKC